MCFRRVEFQYPPSLVHPLLGPFARYDDLLAAADSESDTARDDLAHANAVLHELLPRFEAARVGASYHLLHMLGLRIICFMCWGFLSFASRVGASYHLLHVWGFVSFASCVEASHHLLHMLGLRINY